MDNPTFFETLNSIAIGSITLYAVLSVILLFVICLIAIKIIMGITDRLLEKSKADAALKNFMRSAVKTLLWIVAIMMIAEKLGIKTTSLLAIVSVAGLALSLSIQGIMSNLFSGITILSTRPFGAGDYVEINGEGGTVTDVGFFYTKISTVDNKIVNVPNSQVTGAKLVNYSAEKLRRVDLSFETSYNDPTDKVKTALMDALEADERILKDPKPFVGLLAYKDSSIQYVTRAWVNGSDYWDVYFAMNERVREIFNQRGIEMTYQHVNVHVVKD